jgi:serine/threonine protein phosphatase PrpC
MHDVRQRFESGAATHIGMVRERNEDCYLVRPETGLWAVTDGMGGGESGELASRTVIEALEAIPAPTSAADLLERCEDSIVETNARLKQISQARGKGVFVGTTVAVLLTFDGHYACLWAGDSRIYRVRAGAIEQVSRDHTEVEALVQTGVLSAEEARRHPARNVITRAIGIYEQPELEMEHGRLEGGDVFVICSDGLTAHVTDSEILAKVDRNGSQQACDALVALTLSRGAVDNVTVVVVRYQPADTAAYSGHRPLEPRE